MSSFDLVTEADYRTGVMQFAMSQLGKRDSSPYWFESGLDTRTNPRLLDLAWCGVFALWCLRMANLTDRQWELCHGFIFQRDREQLCPEIGNGSAERGDILFRSKPFQHYALVAERTADGDIDVIAGNVNGAVKGYRVFAQELETPAYETFSIGPLIQAKKGIVP